MSVIYQENESVMESKHMLRLDNQKRELRCEKEKVSCSSDFDHKLFLLLRHDCSVFYNTHIYKHLTVYFLNLKGYGAFWLDPWQFNGYD